ncbi:MAG: hypothetical protein CMO34_03690 [Verrucomicrobia bacterium]|nr:hypothetical protein [Verrucomicrobiota bacterium]
MNILTQLRNAFSRIKEEHPEIIHRIENLPPRVKTAKKYQEDELNVLQRKGIGIFPLQIRDQLQVENKEVELLDIAQFITSIECGIDEQRLKLSDSFWESYNKIKFYQPKSENSQKSEVALETKAHKNLKVYLKLISPAEEKLIEFMKTLIKDIKKYHTLSDRTLGRLGRKEIKTNSNSAALKEFQEELVITMKQLGEDYLEKANEKVKNQRKEIIIAIENLKNVN